MKDLLRFKKGIIMIISIMMILSMVACKPKVEETQKVDGVEGTSLFEAGSYTVTVPGHN